MSKAQSGDTVSVHYTGKLSDETVFDSSRDREPLSFEIGAGKVIPGFEKSVVGMEPGETKTITIESEKAYGPYREDQVVEIEKDRLPEDIEPVVGQQLQVQQASGETSVVVIKDVSNGSVTLDANHPLAGKDLIFDIELVEVT